MVLTDEAIWYFKHSGFHIVPECLPKELMNRLNSVTDDQISEMVEPLVWEKGKEHSPGNIRRLSKILSRDAVYKEAGSHPTILESLEGLLGPNIELLTNKHNHIMVRPPGSEFVYWHSGEEPYNYTLITALIYLEESTLENGCVRIVPGSHMRPFRRSRRPSESFLESDLYNRSLPVPMPRGGILLFNDCCFHGSGVNNSTGSRRSMTLGYRSHDAHDVVKEDPEKILISGERIYTGHPHPYR